MSSDILLKRKADRKATVCGQGMPSNFNFSFSKLAINQRRHNHIYSDRHIIPNASNRDRESEDTNNHHSMMTMPTSQSNSRDEPNAIIKNGINPIENNRRSKNIPLPLSHKHRTESEMQLCEDMETAEQRDLNMFYRLVNGIRERQMTLVRENESSTAAAAFYDPAHTLTEAERSLAHIIHTRNTPVEKKSGTSTTSIRINTGRRNDALANYHANYNPGVPILEGHSDSIHQQERSDHENEWFVGGFDSSSNLSCDQQYRQQQQYPSTNYGFATGLNAGTAGNTTSVTPGLHTAPSSSEIADEGMFDFEL